MKKFFIIVPALILLLPGAAHAIYIEDGSGTNGSVSGDVSITADTAVPVVLDANIEGDATITMEPLMTETDASVTADINSVQANLQANMAAEGAVDVDVKENGDVEIKSQHKGKLFGFIPITFTARTIVEQQEDGTLTTRVSMPWWSFLISGVAEVESNIKTILSVNASADVSVDAAGGTYLSGSSEAESGGPAE